VPQDAVTSPDVVANTILYRNVISVPGEIVIDNGESTFAQDQIVE
jgi:hypothetical protein